MRVAVHTDFEYHAVDGQTYGEHAFTLFFVELAARVDRLVLLGRLDPAASRGRYPVGPRIEFVPLPFYESLVHVRQSVPAMARSLRRFWRALDRVDAVWLLGPNPVQLAFAVLTLIRRRRLVLGVRQSTADYFASRHPGRPSVRLAGLTMELAWRGLARFCPVVVVGPDLARRYRGAPALLEFTASLVSEREIVRPSVALERPYDDEPHTVLSVGRVEAEKNPLILADVLAALKGSSREWRLVVCGEGPMSDALAERLAAFGVAHRAELRGYIPYGPSLQSLYRSSHVLLHASWTEGLPQVLVEAFAAGLPVVATDVGGVREAVGDAAMLVPAGDPAAGAAAIERVITDRSVRRRLVEAGHSYVRARTVEIESRRVVDFLAG